MPKTAAFEDFERNMGFARRLVDGGRRLEQLDVRGFDVADLYRAAWVQAVSALDHWVHQEIYHRAVILVQNPGIEKPDKLRRFEIPVELFDNVHHHDEPLGDAFAGHLRTALGWRSYQNPDKIREGFGYVTDVQLWPAVVERLNREAGRAEFTVAGLKDQLAQIADRRNKIAHEADLDTGSPGGRRAITANDANTTIDWLHAIAMAILEVLDPPADRTGHGYLLVLSYGEAVRWVLEHSRMAFPAMSRPEIDRLAIGDTLYLVTTASCWGPDGTTLVVGTATVTSDVTTYPEPIRIGDREFTRGCDLKLKNLAPFGTGVELGPLAPYLTALRGTSSWGIRLRRALVSLTDADQVTVRGRLTGVTGDPAEHAPGYRADGS